LEPPQRSAGKRSGTFQTDSFAEAAALARAARSNYESPAEEFDTKRLAVMVGGGAAVVLAVVVLGFKLFGSKSEAPRSAAPPVVQAPQYPQEVTDLVAQTEAALKRDDFKAARADVDKLRQLAPSHPRLDFFDGLLAQRIDASSKVSASTNANGRGASKRGAQSSRRTGSNAAPDENGNGTAAGSTTAPSLTAQTSTSPKPTSSPSAASGGSPSPSATAEESAASHTSGFAPETPPGFTRSSTASAAAPHQADAPDAAGSASATGSAAPPAGPTSAAASAPSAPAAEPAEAPTPTTHPSPASATRRASSGEPPPVVREAKLVRSVVPDYPSAAKRDGILGSVDLDVTVSSQGTVEDISVVSATPPDMFEKSAVAAVRKWKYDPRFVDGLPSKAHVKVHLEFGPGK